MIRLVSIAVKRLLRDIIGSSMGTVEFGYSALRDGEWGTEDGDPKGVLGWNTSVGIAP